MGYYILSACGALGYGFPASSLREGAQHKLDLLASDAGSMDPGPYYLGHGVSYFEKAALKHDFSLMLEVALQKKCPLILGSCGLSGDDVHLNFMVDIVKEVCSDQKVKNVKVAIISGHVDPHLLVNSLDALTPLGLMPSLSKEDVLKSKIVGQMGIDPIITALNAGAQIILCGRACDVALFAADPIRKGLDPGLAYHMGHILECGAVACNPGSASDSLAAEFIHDNKEVIFISPNKQRITSPQSIAAHSLYEESHPSLQFYPEGVLTLHKTHYFQHTPEIAGISGSSFIHRPLSIKLEGSQWLGKRMLSLLFLKPTPDLFSQIPQEYLLYGRNGVEARLATEKEEDSVILIKATSSNYEAAKTLASLAKGFMLHFGFPGRRATAGNISFPISPNFISFQEEGKYVSLIIAGTRDPFFLSNYPAIEKGVRDLCKQNFPAIFNECQLEIQKSNAKHPLLFLETIDPTEEGLLEAHEKALKVVLPFIDPSYPSYLRLRAEDAYRWSVYHIWHDATTIKEKLFPIKFYQATGADWTFLEERQPVYQSVGLKEFPGSLDPSTQDGVEWVTHHTSPTETKSLVDIATIIRTKDAGVNTITFDILFKTKEDYQIALKSNAFYKEELIRFLKIPQKNFVGSYKVDRCFAIKISIYREKISGSPGSRDVFGAQQQMKIMYLPIPVYQESLHTETV